jgi:hypothetical protein
MTTNVSTVTKGLQEFNAQRQLKRLLELMGQLEWDGDFDYKEERTQAQGKLDQHPAVLRDGRCAAS